MRRVDKQNRYAYDLREQRIPGSIGNNAKNLHFLIRHRFRVPSTWACPGDPGQDGRYDNHVFLEKPRIELASRLKADCAYARRALLGEEKSAQNGDIS